MGRGRRLRGALLAAGLLGAAPAAAVQVAAMKSGLWCGESRGPNVRVLEDQEDWQYYLASRGNPPGMAHLVKVFDLSFDAFRLLVVEMGHQDTTRRSLRFYGGVLRRDGERLALRVKWTQRPGNRWQEQRASNPCLVIKAAKRGYSEIRIADHHGDPFLFCRRPGSSGEWRCRRQ
jgi:hypothetical protein